ncbi:MAG TPA: CsbD family protein [Streptosporangiaceae bacterium]|nr:CsbD family protein [Streptosporangiaceae bacterium]
MGFMDKLRNKLQMGRGRVKQGVGRAAGDPYLESQGQADRVSGSVKQVGEQAKDAGRNLKDAFRQ